MAIEIPRNHVAIRNRIRALGVNARVPARRDNNKKEAPISATSRISELDVHIGARIRHLRERRGMSRETLARYFEVSHQQFQKYEAGQNRISAGRLLVVARLLDVPISYFFEGLPNPASAESAEPPLASSGSNKLLGLTTECFEFLKMFLRLEHADSRASVLALVQTLADEEQSGA